MLRGIVVITIKAFTIQNFLQLHTLSVCLLVDVLSSFWALMIVQNLFYLSFASGTSSDVLLALSLCFYLWRCQTGFPRTDNLIQALMKYTINTSVLVAWAPVSLFSHQTCWIQIFRLDALAGLITYITMPHNFIFLGKSTQTSVEEDFWSFYEAFYLLLSKRESKFFSSWSSLVFTSESETSLPQFVPRYVSLYPFAWCDDLSFYLCAISASMLGRIYVRTSMNLSNCHKFQDPQLASFSISRSLQDKLSAVPRFLNPLSFSCFSSLSFPEPSWFHECLHLKLIEQEGRWLKCLTAQF